MGQLIISSFNLVESGTPDDVFCTTPVFSVLLYATRLQKLSSQCDIVFKMSEEQQEVDEGLGEETVEEPVQEEEVVEPARGLVYVDLSESQACIMPGRPNRNEPGAEDDSGSKVKFEDANIVGDTTMARRRNFVKQILGIDDSEVRSDVFVDYMTNAVYFCQESNFSDEQTSAFFAIAKRTFQASKGDETTKITAEAFLNRDDAYKAFHNLLVQHSMEKPPERVKVFTKEEVKSITVFMNSTYFRHYRAYESAFTKEQELRRLPLDVVLETHLRQTPLTAAKDVPRPVPVKAVEETPDEIDNSNDNEEVKEQEESKSEEAVEEEELIEIPEHLQEIVKKKVEEEQNRLNKELEELTNTLEKKRLLLVNEDEVDAAETAESGEEVVAE